MLWFAWSTFRDRWTLFLGAVVTTALAVACTQASLLALVSAATADIPPGLHEPDQVMLENGYITAITMLSLMTGISVFVSIFVVASTFAFAVAQRRRDVALLRLIGADRHQVRRMLRSEALILGTIATAAGIPLGVAAAAIQDRLLVRWGLVPDGFRTAWHPWAIGVSAGVGVVVANLAARIAARAAGRVRPLDALREGGGTDRVMTAARWVIGAVGVGGAIALMIVTPHVGAAAAAAVAINTVFVLVIALTAWSPLIVPAVASAITVLSRTRPTNPLAELAGANLRSATRRTAATAAPAIVLCGLVVGVNGTFDALGRAARHQAQVLQTSDIIAIGDEPIRPVLDGVAGVECASADADVAVHVLAADFDDEPLVDTRVLGLAIEPGPYLCTHHVRPDRGDLERLTGATIAVDRALAEQMRVGLGDTTTITVAGTAHAVEVVAITSAAFSPLPELWLPSRLLDQSAGPAIGTHRLAIRTADAAATDRMLQSLAHAGISASTTADWLRSDQSEQQRQNRSIQIALIGLSSLFTVVAIANAVVNAAAQRRKEFATLRLIGLTRAQVLLVALGESAAVLATAISLGTLAALGPVHAVHRGVSRAIGTDVSRWPWPTLGTVTVVTAVVIGTACVLTTTAMTTPRDSRHRRR